MNEKLFRDDAHPTDDEPEFSKRVPQGDSVARQICDRCGYIHYINPKIVVGSVVLHDDRILMCRRAIEPRRGFWTLPAGFMEMNETTEEAALREAREEANAEIEIDGLLAVYSIPRISQVQMMYRAHLRKPGFSAGPESSEVRLVAWDGIPWEELAFPSVHWALNHFDQARGQKEIVPFTNPEGETGNAFPGRHGL